MAVQVGTLVVTIVGNVTRLLKGLATAGRGLLKFEGRTKKIFRGIGRGLLRLSKRFVGFGVLVGAAAGALSFVGIAKGAIQAASDIETFQIRLQNLIGSQRQANQSIENLRKFATRVAPSLRDLVEAAATLGTVALGSATKIDVLTRTAANISAVTGLTLTQASQNLQRALSAGIGAADLFRERGVKALLESITGFANLVDAPISKVAEAFELVFGPDSQIFGQAAVDFATTLPAAISTTGDALFNFQAALGAAISPALLGALAIVRGIFNRLTIAITENEEAVGELARQGIIFLATNLLRAVRAVAFLVSRVLDLRQGFAELQVTILQVISVLAKAAPLIGFLTAGPAGFLAGSAIALAAAFVDVDEAIEGAKIEAAESQTAYLKAAASMETFRAEAKLAQAELEGLGEAQVAAAKASRDAAAKRLEALQARFREQTDPIDARTQREAEAAQKRGLALLDRRAKSSAKITSSTKESIIALEQENVKIRKNAADALKGVQVLRQGLEARKKLLSETTGTTQTDDDERVRLTGEIAAHEKAIVKHLKEGDPLRARSVDALKQNVFAIELLESKLARLPGQTAAARTAFGELQEQLKVLNAEASGDLTDKLIEGLKKGLTAEELLELFRKLGKEASGEIEAAIEEAAPDLSDTIGGTVSGGIQDALVELGTTGSLDFAQTLASLTGEFLDQALTDVLDGFGEGINKALEGLTAEGGIFEGLGSDKLGSALSGALGIGTALVAGALRDSEVDASSADIESAVNSSQAIRGVVAGPTNIPIFQVANAIRDAFIETNAILVEQTDILRDIRSGGGFVGSGVPTGDSVNQQLDRGPSLG